MTEDEVKAVIAMIKNANLYCDAIFPKWLSDHLRDNGVISGHTYSKPITLAVMK